ncbi:MAG: porin family protein, partial [Pseudomonadota bacterium]
GGTYFRHSKYLYSSKIVVFICLCFLSQFVQAQYSVYEHDMRYSNKYFHFGITLGVNNSNYKITPDSVFIVQNKILKIETGRGLGFNLGILSDLHLSNKFELRFIPTLSLGEKNLFFTIKNQDTLTSRKIESVYLEFPFHFKYKSKPYKDIRPYVIGGLKYSIDMQSNAGARRAENLIKVNRNDIAFEYGIGVELHFPMVIISPEIKVSYGLNNVLAQDEKLLLSSAIQRLRTRTILFCIHFEG